MREQRVKKTQKELEEGEVNDVIIFIYKSVAQQNEPCLDTLPDWHLKLELSFTNIISPSVFIFITLQMGTRQCSHRCQLRWELKPLFRHLPIDIPYTHH